MKNGNSRKYNRRDLGRRVLAYTASALLLPKLTGCGIRVDRDVTGGEDPDVSPTPPSIPFVPENVTILPLEQIVDNPQLFEVNGGAIPANQFVATWGYLPNSFLIEGQNGRGQARSYYTDTHGLGLFAPGLYALNNSEPLSLMQGAVLGGMPLTFVGKYIEGSAPIVIDGKNVGGTLDIYGVKLLDADPLEDPNYESNISLNLIPIVRP